MEGFDDCDSLRVTLLFVVFDANRGVPKGVRGVGGQSSSLNKGGSGYAKPYIGGTAM